MICLFLFPCGILFCWATAWALCSSDTWNTQKMKTFISKAAFPFQGNICLPGLCRSFCSHITLYQQTDLSFAPVDPFTHSFIHSVSRLRILWASQGYTWWKRLCTGLLHRAKQSSWGMMPQVSWFCITSFILAISYMWKVFSQLLFPRLHSITQSNRHNCM